MTSANFLHQALAQGAYKWYPARNEVYHACGWSANFHPPAASGVWAPLRTAPARRTPTRRWVMGATARAAAPTRQ